MACGNLVARTRFELVISALRGRRPKPLDERAVSKNKVIVPDWLCHCNTYFRVDAGIWITSYRSQPATWVVSHDFADYEVRGRGGRAALSEFARESELSTLPR